MIDKTIYDINIIGGIKMEFSPGKVEKILISLRIEEPFLNKIDVAATEREMSRNEFICQPIAYAMDHMEKKKLEE